MPVDLPKTEIVDARLLSLLRQMADAGGALLMSEEDLAAFEREIYFVSGENKGLFRIDQGGEWSAGVALSITDSGLRAIGHEQHPGLLRSFERMLRRYMPRANG